jgi:plastocyanin
MARRFVQDASAATIEVTHRKRRASATLFFNENELGTGSAHSRVYEKITAAVRQTIMTHFGTSLRNALLTVVAATLAACSGGGYGAAPSGPPPGDGKTIDATPSLSFTPATLTVNAGETVTFAFGGIGHNVLVDAQAGAPADIGGINANVSVTRVFNTAGTYHYDCHIHPGMHGTVVFT